MRVYLPATLGHLQRLVDGGPLPAPTPGFAVTPALREWYSDGDIEDLEYVAMRAAARASLPLLADTGPPWRRVVLAVEVADAAVAWAPAEGRAAVVVTAQVRPVDVAAAHVDGPDEAAVIAAAARAVSTAVGVDVAVPGPMPASLPASLPEVEEAEDVELQWWATQEIEQLLPTAAELSAPPAAELGP